MGIGGPTADRGPPRGAGVRFGLLSNVTATVVLTFLYLPVTTDSSAFYFGNGLVVMGLVLALALYGSFTSLGGRPLFRDR